MKTQTRNFIITAGVIIALFAAVIGGYYWQQQETVKPYNNFQFVKDGQLWITTAQKGDQPYRIPFYNHPSTLENIVAEPDVEQPLLEAGLNNESNVSVFISVDPTLSSRAVVGGVEISRLTGDRYDILNLPTRSGLLREPVNQSAATDTPIVTCDAASDDRIVIALRRGPSNLITTEGDCIVLEATNGENMLRVADRFAYMILGVMD
jgi:hypothetical protein